MSGDRFDQRSAVCRRADAIDFRRLRTVARGALGSGDTQCVGRHAAGHEHDRAMNQRRVVGRTAAMVDEASAAVGRRSDADSLSWPTVSRSQRNLSFSAQKRHDTLSRLCQLLRRRARTAVHAGDDVGRQGRTAQRDAATTASAGAFPGRQNPFSAAGQGVLQRQRHSLSASLPHAVLDAGRPSRTQAGRPDEGQRDAAVPRSEEHTSELQSH